MPVEILMPELGESVHEGTVSRWLKQVGDYVKEDEPVVEIMTDKVNTELQAPASGVLVKIIIPEGDPVQVFSAMGLIEPNQEAARKQIADGGGGAAAAPAPATPEAPAPARQPLAPAAEEENRRFYTPVVRSMAKEHGLDERELGAIAGTGEGGRVTKKDLEAYLAKRGAPAPAPAPAPAVAPAPVAPKPVAPTQAGPEQEIIPLAGMRKMIADFLTVSAAVPVVTTLTEVDVTNMVRFRDANKTSFEAQYGVRLTYTPFFIKALTEALLEYPLVNSSLQADNKILLNRAVHIGVAVALGAKGDEGLIVPVIRDCHKKSLIEIAKDLETVAKKARTNSLAVSDVQGGTFTLTNPGSYGAILGTPMINAPQAGILGTYAIKKMPVVIDDMIAIRSIMNLVLTYDHRLVDGMLAGKFLQSLKAKMETFDFFR